MANSIFDIEIRIDINKEFKKMVKYLHYIDDTTETFDYSTSFIRAVNYYAFKQWPYRGTAIDCMEYLENLGLKEYHFDEYSHIDIKQFLYYIEFIYNIYMFSTLNHYIEIQDENVKAIFENIGLIVEKMNLKFIQDGNKFILVKRDADVDSVISLVDESISLLLLEYNDFRVMNNLKRKQEILKAIDKYIEENQSEYSKIDKETYSSIGYIMNNFGINHKINEKYVNYTDKELLKWYDDCFLLVIHLIRKVKIKYINEERKLLET